MKLRRYGWAYGRSASVIALSVCSLAAPHALAQTQATSAVPEPAPVAQADGTPQTSDEGEIVVTGIRASLDRAIDIKRNSSGVVDAISAEDIGKFPDTNLAESLQRVTGVSIDRVNGEGSQVTVRGFGGGFNLVTLNGRQLPAANVPGLGGDQNADFAAGTGRSFDFANLASEGVSALEVYKTGRAAVPSGGIGAAINVVTRKPLDAREDGLFGSIGVKALYDTSVEEALNHPSVITPEASGFASWADPENRFGVALFGSYQKRNFTTRGATVNGWNIRRYSEIVGTGGNFVNSATRIENAPSDPNTLVGIPNDSSYNFSEGQRERINGSAVAQFRPVETLTFTADVLFAQNKQREQRAAQGNWFNRPFGQIVFDDNDVVATPLFLQETIAGTKDTSFEQASRGLRNRLLDYGLNARWDITDRFTLSVDGHIGEAKSDPNNPNGVSSTLVGIGATVIAAQSADYSGRIPVQSIVFNDARTSNGNGLFEVNDLGSSIGRTISSSQRQRIKEARADAGWEFGDAGSRLDFGGNYRTSDMRQLRVQTQQTLGNWGIENPGDAVRLAPGVLRQYCLVCKLKGFDYNNSGALRSAFFGQATDLYNAISPFYAQNPSRQVETTVNENNQVREEIWSVYGQATFNTEVAGLRTNIVGGLRYENTKTTSTSLQAVPIAIDWVSDNDFTPVAGPEFLPVSGEGSYDNFLPSLDIAVDLTRTLKLRGSYSRTIARPDFGSLFASTSAGTPPRPTALGGLVGGSRGNPGLDPLVSDNLDASLEWYYKPSSYFSFGLFGKRVKNFVGVGQTTQELFGLRDPSSGAAGTRSGTALAELRSIGADLSDVNLFTLTALLQQTGSIATARQRFLANFAGGQLNQAFVDSVLAAVDLRGNEQDPLYQFQVTQPINNRTGKVYGFEAAVQHFFGETGFGVAAAYTLVRGDVNIDVGADPSQDQFALVGLSDTANATLIYDKNGLSARLSYNWRDRFLQVANLGGGDRNPRFVAPFGQFDMNISYDLSPRLAVSLEAINITASNIRTYGRSERQIWYAQDLDPRFLLGIRTRF